MANQQYFFDRVEIYADNIAYLPDGQIRNFGVNASYNTKILQGFSPTGNATGKVVGNTTIDNINWTEFLPAAEDYVNWRAFCLANPGAVFTVVPVTLALGQPLGITFTLTGVDPTSIKVGAPGEGEVMTRDCTFNALYASNLS